MVAPIKLMNDCELVLTLFVEPRNHRESRSSSVSFGESELD